MFTQENIRMSSKQLLTIPACQFSEEEKLDLRDITIETNQRKLFKQLIKEIPTFSRAKLRSQTVYFVNRALSEYGAFPFSFYEMKTHGFVAIGNPGTDSKKGKGFGTIYHMSNADWTHAPYIVDKNLLIEKLEKLRPVCESNAVGNEKTKEATEKENTLINNLITIIKKLNRKYYVSSEHFLWRVLIELEKINDKQITEENFPAHIYDQASCLTFELPHPLGQKSEYEKMGKCADPLLQALIPHIDSGAAQFCDHHRNPGKQDRLLFEKMLDCPELKSIPYPHIDPECVKNIYRQQQLAYRYLDEKSGIGKVASNEMKKEAKADPSLVRQSLSHYVLFRHLPDQDDEYTTNCNKGAASLIQAAEDLSAETQQNRPRKKIHGASLFSIGVKQRMHLWNPLIINKQIEQILLDEKESSEESKNTKEKEKESISSDKLDKNNPHHDNNDEEFEDWIKLSEDNNTFSRKKY